MFKEGNSARIYTIFAISIFERRHGRLPECQARIFRLKYLL